jgi:recombinational DNA repair protein RecR
VHLFVFAKNVNEWSCSTCTYLNTYEAKNCQICQSKRDESSINFQFKDSLEFKIFNEQVIF